MSGGGSIAGAVTVAPIQNTATATATPTMIHCGQRAIIASCPGHAAPRRP
jgi:hypothetical protein